MDNSLILVPIVCGTVLLLAGCLLYKYPPKRINILYGYRTKSSMQNQETWDFAQRVCARVAMKAGVFCTLASVSGLFYNPGKWEGALIGIGYSLLAVAYLFYKVEKAISVKFKSTSHA